MDVQVGEAVALHIIRGAVEDAGYDLQEPSSGR